MTTITFVPESEIDRRLVELTNEAHRYARYYYSKAKNSWLIFDDLTGACAVASGYLFFRLRQEGYTAQVATNPNHAFVMVDIGDRSIILDPTASQFSFLKRNVAFLEILPIEEYDHKHQWWMIDHVFDSLDALVAAQKTLGWPPCQIAKKRYRKIEKG